METSSHCGLLALTCGRDPKVRVVRTYWFGEVGHVPPDTCGGVADGVEVDRCRDGLAVGVPSPRLLTQKFQEASEPSVCTCRIVEGSNRLWIQHAWRWFIHDPIVALVLGGIMNRQSMP